ncbi:MAG: hypothetical protein IPJ26_19985 [Bacteroidetes bacterium]|nr:hypothetical protein [Bacteroidota bacterium]
MIYSTASVNRADSYNWVVPAGATITNGQGTSIITVSYGPSFVGGSMTVTASEMLAEQVLFVQEMLLLMYSQPLQLL